jgi:transcriptional regulator with XRE-family HTH domain
MGRAEAPLEQDGTAAVELAYWLRELRRNAGLTYTEIALMTNYAASSLQGACSGRHLPSKKITLAIVTACAGDLPAWSDYWSRLRRLAAQDGEADLRPPWLTVDPEPAVAPAAAPVAHAVDGPHPDLAPARQPVGESARALPGLSSRRWRSPVRQRLVWLASIAASFAGGVLLGQHLLHGRPAVPRDSASQASAHGLVWERESNRYGAPSVADPHQPAVLGPDVPFGKPVQVTCEVRVTDGSAEMAWYRVASQPWTDKYYVPAPDFATLATGTAVPNC